MEIIKHSECETLINIKITSIFNYINLLSDEDKDFLYQYKINEKKQKVINEEKKKEFLKIYNEKKKRIIYLNEKTEKDKNSILLFQEPEFEIYIVGKLYVDNEQIEPECTTKILFNSQNIDYPFNFQYSYNNLTLDSYIILWIYSIQFEDKIELLGKIKINLFDENGFLFQGRQIYTIENKLLNIDKNIDEKKEEKILHDLSELINEYYNKGHKGQIIKSNFYGENLDIAPVEMISDIIVLPSTFADKVIENKENEFSTEDILNIFFYKENNVIEIKNDSRIEYENQLKNILKNSTNSFIEIEFLKFNKKIFYEETPFNNKKEKEIKKDWIYDSMINNVINDKIIDDPVREKISTLLKINNNIGKDAQWTSEEKERIEILTRQPDFIKLDCSDLTLFWIYRYKLLEIKQEYAITKILNSVKWGDLKDEKEFIHNILYKWKKIEISDILYMLSRNFCVNHFYKSPFYVNNNFKSLNDVREFALGKLEKKENEDLHFILLQLVQALRYEDFSDSPLRKTLIDKCSKNKILASSFFWFIMCECPENLNNINKDTDEYTISKFYLDLKNDFLECLSNSKNLDNLTAEEKLNLEEIHNCIVNEVAFKNGLIAISQELKSISTKVDKQKEKLKQILSEQDKENLSEINNEILKNVNIQKKTYPLPLDPNIMVKGVKTENCTIFRSNLRPVKYTFNITPETQKYNKKDNPKEYSFIFKYGDDLRQDQLILQMISYMDSILQKFKLNYEFTSYKVLATSKSDGFVEFVPNSTTIYDIVSNKKLTIKQYIDQFVDKNNKEDAQKRLDTYINSSAGYSIATFILGIGDRHLENLMIDDKGRLFHIDFGYILGKDIKVAAPLIKLSKEMLEPMGGKGSQIYENFKLKCVNAYWILRDKAREIVNMFYLMIDSGIPQLNNIEDLYKLHDKFVPGYSKQEASNSILSKIDESANAFGGSMIDIGHKIAGFWKY